MPFKSEKQRKWMHTNEPEMADKWEKKEGHDKEGKMAKYDAKEIAQDAVDVFKMIDETTDLPEWLEAKVTKAADYMNSVKDYLTHHQSGVNEAKKRDYKAEYKKFQSSTKAKKYRAELNKYNRQKGTYGNGDKKDASHKGGKIVGFEEQSKNRGRREKSRLKKEQKITEKVQWKKDKKIKGKWYTNQGTHKHQAKANVIAGREWRMGRSDTHDTIVVKEPKGYTIYVRPLKEQKLREVIRNILIDEGFGGELTGAEKKEFEKVRKEQSEVLGYKLVGKSDIKEAAAGGLTYKKGKTITVTHKTSGKELVIIDKPNVRKEYEKIGYVAEGKLTEVSGVEKVLSMAQNHSFGKLGGRTIDAMSANLFKQVYEKTNDNTKEKINKMNEKQLYVFMTKLWTKFGKQVRI